MEARGGLMILLIGFLKLICSAPSDPSPLMLVWTLCNYFWYFYSLRQCTLNL